jgi:predicted metal-dependent hydrolase
MFSYQAGNITIDYTVEAVPNVQEITVNVCPNNGVKLVVPRSLNQSNLHFIIAKKAKWILEQLGKTPVEAKEEPAEPKKEEARNETQAAFVPSFQDGDKIPYLGRQYRLNIVKEDKAEAELTFRAKFLATVPASWNEQQINKGLQALLTDWYINRAGDKFQECLKSLAKQMHEVPSQIEWEDLQNETSSVKADGTIVLNWRLLTAPMSTIELVLAREIAKSKDAAELFEDAAERQQWLEENTLVVF